MIESPTPEIQAVEDEFTVQTRYAVAEGDQRMTHTITHIFEDLTYSTEQLIELCDEYELLVKEIELLR